MQQRVQRIVAVALAIQIALILRDVVVAIVVVVIVIYVRPKSIFVTREAGHLRTLLCIVRRGLATRVARRNTAPTLLAVIALVAVIVRLSVASIVAGNVQPRMRGSVCEGRALADQGDGALARTAR